VAPAGPARRCRLARLPSGDAGLDADALLRPETLDADFRLRPRFEEKVLEHRDGHLIVQDWKGNICEISDRYDVTYLREPKDFVTRRWIKCPVESRQDWEEMRERYVADDPQRLPPVGNTNAADCATAITS